MKDWVFGRKLMAEEGGADGDAGGGGGGKSEEAGGKSEGSNGDAPPVSHDSPDAPAPRDGEGERNALGEELDKGSSEPPKGDQPGDKKDQPDPGAPTEEEARAYADAIRLDEEAFGKGAKLSDEYSAQLPAFFKKHGIAADKANALVNDFVKMQKEAEKGAAAKAEEFAEWRRGEMKKMNDAYYATYDKAGRDAIVRAIAHFFPKGSPMYEAVCMTEVGVDPGFLKAMKFVGDRLAKDAAPGAASGAGAEGGKSISDSFMGL